MTHTRANQISDLHHRTLAQAPADRDRFLRDACGDDEALRQAVESLLRFESAADGFLERPAVAALADGPGPDVAQAFAAAGMAGRTLGSYTLTARIGAGGMGEVYRARDSKLGRDVAIKVLPLTFASDPDRRSRFAREARVLATLNHPNIGAIYGLEEADGVTALVLELVEGETLARRLERRPLPLVDAIFIAAQIADALDAAHEKGIVHRDLKPANIVLQGGTDARSSDLRAKVLDFGIAKLVPGRFEDLAISVGETTGAPIVGTPAYMSPEQARGQPVDARTDVWAFGCVLYEMIVGRAAFGGATVSDTIVNVLERDPDWQALPPSTPSSIQRLLGRCLAKDPKHRLHAIADVSFDLEEARAGSEHQRRTAVQTRPRAAWVIAVTFVVLASAAAAWQAWSTRSANLPSPRVMPLTSYPGIEASPALSPDGRQVAFSWDGEKGQNEDIHVVMIGADNPLPVTSDPARDVAPAWKPDGSVIAFARVESGRASIYLVSPLGGSEKKLAAFSAVPYPGAGPIESRDPRLAWSPDGRWLTVGNVTSGAERGVFLVAEDGRQELMLKANPGDNYSMAALSPTGDRLALINGGIIEIAEVGGTNRPTINGAPRRLTSFLGHVSGLAWAADGKSLLFGRSRYPAPDPPSLWRVPTSDDGTPQRIDLAGVAAYPSISAAASRLAFVRRGLNLDLFKLEEGSPAEAFLASTSNEQDASFSHDGTRIAFASDRTGDGHEIWIARADGSNRRAVTNGMHKPEGSPRWSPNDDRLAFDGVGDDGQRHIYLIDPAGGPIQMIPSKPGVSDQVPSWSRDGKWIYFGSNRTGRPEVWRVPAAGGAAEQVTTTGGEYAFESWDGQTVYYLRTIGGARTLFAMPLPRGQEQPLDIQVTFWNYIPAEHGLYYMSLRQGQRAPFTYEVRFVDSRTGQSRVVHRVTLADAAPGLSVTPDGKTVVIQGVAVVTQDLVRIENFR
jgi:eukaryotic-like serine/threonine-protein kinase